MDKIVEIYRIKFNINYFNLKLKEEEKQQDKQKISMNYILEGGMFK